MTWQNSSPENKVMFVLCMRLNSAVFCMVIAAVNYCGLCSIAASELGADDISMMSPEINTSPGPEYNPESVYFQGIPGIECSPKGRLWATWYAGGQGEGPENYVVVTSSSNNGRAWSPFCFVIDPPGECRAFDPCLWHDPSGRLWLFWAQAYGHTEGSFGTWAISTDESDQQAPVWSEPRRICEGIMMNKPIVLPTGDWLLPAAIWHRLESCRVVCSRDEGKTFELVGTASVPEAKDRNCDEPMMVQRTDDSLLMWVRTKYGIGESISNDEGTTWTPVAPTNIPHPSARFFIRRLESGNLLLVKHGAIDRLTGRSHLTAFISKDDGQSWEGGFLVDEREQVSYPDGVQSADGLINIIYDYQRTGAKEILMASFREEDVLAGKDVSQKVCLRMLVNKANGKLPESSVTEVSSAAK